MDNKKSRSHQRCPVRLLHGADALGKVSFSKIADDWDWAVQFQDTSGYPFIPWLSLLPGPFMAGSGQPRPKKNTFCNGEPKKLLYWQNLDCLEVQSAHAVGLCSQIRT